MIGEYKCSNYVAKSILAEVAPAHIFEIDGYDAEPKGNNSTVCTIVWTGQVAHGTNT